jgi:hypothetical protein
LASRTEGAFRHLFHDVVAADGFNDFFLGIVALVFVVVIIVAIGGGGLFGAIRGLAAGVFGMFNAAVFGAGRIVGVGGVLARLFVAMFMMRMFVMPVFIVGLRDRKRVRGSFDGCRIRRVGSGFRGGRLDVVGMAVVIIVMRMFMVACMFVRMLMIVMVMVPGIVMVFSVRVVMLGLVRVGMTGFVVRVFRVFVVVVRRGGRHGIDTRAFDDLALDALAIAASARVAVARTATPVVGAVLGFLFGLAVGALVRLDQRLTVGHRYLVIIGVDFAEGQEAVAVAAIFDEGRLQRRLYPRDLGEVDVAAQLFALGGFEIKFFDAIAADHDNPGLFRVGGIDQHFVGHFGTLGGGGRV